MAKFRMPPPDVAPIVFDNETKSFKWNPDVYDALKALERLGFLDLADVSTTAPLNNQVPIYLTATKLLTFGTN